MAKVSEAAQAFLREKRFAVLATIGREGIPQQTVMWYDLDGDDILMNTAAGRVKSSNLRRDARASVCVEDGYRFVTIDGPVTLIEDQATAQADIRRLALRYHGAEGVEARMQAFGQQQRVTLRLRAEHVLERGFEV